MGTTQECAMRTAMAYAVCVVVLAVFATAASEGDDRVVLLQEDGIPAPARMAAQKLWKQAAAMSDMRTGEFTKMQMPGQALKEAAVPNTAPSKPPAVAAVASAQKKIANAEQRLPKQRRRPRRRPRKAAVKAAKKSVSKVAFKAAKKAAKKVAKKATAKKAKPPPPAMNKKEKAKAAAKSAKKMQKKAKKEAKKKG